MAKTSKPSTSTLPSIYYGKQLSEECDEIIDILVDANTPPGLFRRGGTLAKISIDERHCPEVEVVDGEILLNRIARVANHFKKNRKGDWVPTHPTIKHANQIIKGWRELPFPPIVAVTEVPILREDYSIVDVAGYDAQSHYYYQPDRKLHIPQIPQNPTQDDAIAAAGRVFDYISEFPYVSDVDRANMCGLLLTTVTRSLYPLAPMALLTAPKMGTGKTLLYKVVMILLTGRVAPTTTMPNNEAEMGKTLTGLLLSGTICSFVFDNIDTTIDSAKLGSFLTTEIWKERVITTPYAPELVQRTIPIATGNNLQVGGDMKRRCYLINLDADVSAPWEREGPAAGQSWKYHPLLTCIRKHRGQMLADLLTIARAWKLAGEPAASIKVHFADEFSEWARTTSGMLEFVGVQGFLQNSPLIVDVGGTDWEAFLTYWHDHYQRPMTARELTDELERDTAFADLLPDKLPGYFADDKKRTTSFPHTLSKSLGKKLNTPFGSKNFRVATVPGGHSNIAEFYVAEHKQISPTIINQINDASHASHARDNFSQEEKYTQDTASSLVSSQETASSVDISQNGENHDSHDSHGSQVPKKPRISIEELQRMAVEVAANLKE